MRDPIFDPVIQHWKTPHVEQVILHRVQLSLQLNLSMFDFQSQPIPTEPGLSAPPGMMHMIGWNIQWNLMHVSVIHAGYLDQEVVVLAAGQKQHSSQLASKTGSMQQENRILVGHNNCISHKQTIVTWRQFQHHSKQGISISEQLGKTRTELIQKNHHYIKAIAEVVLLCNKQKIALRGHRKSSQSLNRGNFLKILGVVVLHDKFVLDKLNNGPKNACYTSPEIQNQLLQIMASIVREIYAQLLKSRCIFCFS